MWFDIIRKKVVAMWIVRDIFYLLDDVFSEAIELPRKIKNSKFRDARSTYIYVAKNMYVIEWDEVEEKTLPRVRESEAYVKHFEKILKELGEWYNSIPKETKRENENIFRAINKKLNAANSLLLDSDFVFQNDRRSWGVYSPSTDTSKVNVPKFAEFADDEEELIEAISEVLSHEFGHQASESIDSPTRVSSFYEEMLAYLVEFPDDKQHAFESWLGHPDVKEAVQKDSSGILRELYDEIKMATKSGIIGNKKNNQLYDDITDQLYSVMDLQTNPTRSIQYN